MSPTITAKAAKSTPVITGFYRFTDILFEWHKTIPDPTERSALKAFVSAYSLGDPSNPLWVDKEKGLQLFLGTLHAGKVRLLYSSKQVEYIRYWLHNMGYTRSLFPLPSSEYLLTESSLKNHEPVYYKTAEEIKKALRQVDKINSRLRGADSSLLAFRLSFEKVRRYWAAKTGTWLCIDFEAWEMDHTVLTECGWTMLRRQGDKETETEGHFIVKEHMTYRNGKYVADARDRYNFGKSEIMSKSEFKRRINDMISESAQLGPLYLVFHDCHQDLKILKSDSINAPLEEMSYILPENPSEKGIFVIDTSDLYAALEGDASERRSLDKMCKLLKFEAEHVHNAGNDAHYTLLCLKSMASGNQIDAQREERWPDQVRAAEGGPTSIKVVHQPWEEDSDYSDLEGAYGRPVDGSLVAKHLEGLDLSDDEF